MAVPEPIDFKNGMPFPWPVGVSKLVVLVTKGGTQDADGSNRDWVRAFAVDVDTATVKAVFDFYPENDAVFVKAVADAKAKEQPSYVLTIADKPLSTMKGHDPDPPPKKSVAPTTKMLTVVADAASAIGKMQVVIFDLP